MIEVTLDKKDYLLPENWSEVPNKNFRELLGLVYATEESGRSLHEILRLALDIRPKAWARFIRQFFGNKVAEDTREKNAETLHELLHLLQWMWTENLTKCPFPFFEIHGQKFYLFDEGFKSMSFGEMTDAYIHAHAFLKQLEEGETRLNKLLAILCRPEIKIKPADWNGDKREPYNSFVAENREKLYKKLPIKDKLMVLAYFLGTLREFLAYFDIFDNDGPPKEEEYPGQSYIKNQHLLAEKGIFGNMEATKKTNIHDVFLFLEEHKKDIEEQIRRQKATESNDSY